MKKYQNGVAESNMLVVLGTIGSLVMVIAFVIMYFSASNYGVAAEARLNASWVNAQNINGQYVLKIQEAASVPEIYKNDLKEVIAAEFSGRYGPDGSRAAMQWIKERSNKFDSSLYTKIQQLIEAGRNEFQAAQTRVIDEKRAYETALGTVPRSWFLSMAGFPRTDLSKYKPVVAADTAEAFRSGVQAPTKLR